MISLTLSLFIQKEKERTCTQNWCEFSRKAPRRKHLMRRLWLSFAYWNDLLFLFFFFLQPAEFSLIGTVNKHGRKGGGEKVDTLLLNHSLPRTCICNGTIKMQHPGIFGVEAYAGAYVVNHWGRQLRFDRVPPTHLSSLLWTSPAYPLLSRSALGPPAEPFLLSSSSSLVARLPRVGISTAAHVGGLSVFR